VPVYKKATLDCLLGWGNCVDLASRTDRNVYLRKSNAIDLLSGTLP
jgi:hypothetical protein